MNEQYRLNHRACCCSQESGFETNEARKAKFNEDQMELMISKMETSDLKVGFGIQLLEMLFQK